MLKIVLRIVFVVAVAIGSIPLSAQYHTSDRRMSGYDRSRYNHRSGSSDVVDIYCPRAGELSKLLSPQQGERVRLLIVEGSLNGDDIKYIVSLCKRKSVLNERGTTIDNYLDLDLSRARIRSGNSYYYGAYRTHSDELGDYMFYSCTHLRSIVLPDYLTIIGEKAFRNCYNLEEVIMPSTVSVIASEAFADCYDLQTVFLSENLREIGDKAFSECKKLTQVSLPPMLQYIGTEAFYSAKLREVVLPQSLVTLGASAFGNSSLTSLSIPANTKIDKNDIGDISTLSRIDVADDNPYYSSGNGVLYNKDFSWLIRCPRAKSGAVEVADGTMTIADGAFKYCSKVTSISLPATVSVIGTSAFGYCYTLQNVIMPPEVSVMGEETFTHCSQLASINVPDGIAVLPKEIFRDCKALSYVGLPMSINTIAKGALRGTAALRYIDLPLGVTAIEKEAFRGSGLQYIDLPNGLKTIGDQAFREVALTTLVIPETVTTIGSKILEKTKSATSVVCLATVPPALSKVSDEKRPLYVPAVGVAAYKKAKNWKKIKQILPYQND